MDVCTRDAATGRAVFVDTMVTCVHSGREPRRRDVAAVAGEFHVDEKQASVVQFDDVSLSATGELDCVFGCCDDRAITHGF